ncbi:MAG: hypothetical protein O7F76_13465 [Planctomycetota bacterium]|nr:hypothetical protein [Planctomycetota bacterium]MCZ6817690.1 hypothetical protein [Planctomycetota bacterium]
MGAIAEAPIRIVADGVAEINAILGRIAETSIAAARAAGVFNRFYLPTGIRAIVRCADLP